MNYIQFKVTVEVQLNYRLIWCTGHRKQKEILLQRYRIRFGKFSHLFFIFYFYYCFYFYFSNMISIFIPLLF